MIRFARRLGTVIVLVSLILTARETAARTPTIQERRAMQNAEAQKMKKMQEIEIFKRQRDELLVNYQALVKMKNEFLGHMKVAERDYKIAQQKFEQAKSDEQKVQGRMGELHRNRDKQKQAAIERELGKLRETQDKLIGNMNMFSRIQQDSYEKMKNYDMQFRNLSAKEQVLKQQIELVQRQLEFVISQP